MLSSVLRSSLINATKIALPICSRVSHPLLNVTRTISTSKSLANRSFLNSLDEKIKIERENVIQGQLSFPGFEVTTNGSNVKLTKRYKSEAINVNFCVNESINGDLDDQEGEEEQEIMCTPDFIVEIINKQNKKVVINCEFDDSEFEQDETNQRGGFLIVDVAFPDTEGLTNSTYYFSDCSNQLDQELYDCLMNMLKERGLDSEFADNLVDCATQHENKLYLNFLNDMHSFVQNCEDS